MSLSKFTKFISVFLLVSSFFIQLTVLVPAASAQTTNNSNDFWKKQVGSTGVENAYKVSSNSTTDVRVYVVNVIKVFLSLLGLIFLIVIILSGYRWMTAGGNEEKVKDAKKQLRNGIIGFVVILLSYAIVDFVVNLISDEVFNLP